MQTDLVDWEMRCLPQLFSEAEICILNFGNSGEDGNMQDATKDDYFGHFPGAPKEATQFLKDELTLEGFYSRLSYRSRAL